VRGVFFRNGRFAGPRLGGLGASAVLGVGFVVAASALAASSPIWSVQPSPSPESGASLAGVSCTSASACIAVGASGLSTHEAPAGLRTLVERWDGRSWSIQPTVSMRGGLFSGVSCTSATACTAVGQGRGRPLVERWDGRTWSIQPTPSTRGRSLLAGVSCTSPRACIAVGYGNIAKNQGLLAERWNGRKWSTLPIPAPRFGSLFGVSCTSARACTAVGRVLGNNVKTLVERWNGREWSIQPTPQVKKAYWLNSVWCNSVTLCTAVGVDDLSPPPCGYGPPCSSAKPHIKTLAERWNGRTWSIQPTPSPARLSTLYGVLCTSASACTAVGGPSPLAEHWNGHVWSVQPLPQLGSYAVLGGIACAGRTAAPRSGTSVTQRIRRRKRSRSSNAKRAPSARSRLDRSPTALPSALSSDDASYDDGCCSARRSRRPRPCGPLAAQGRRTSGGASWFGRGRAVPGSTGQKTSGGQ
jgi:hypothetical protein